MQKIKKLLKDFPSLILVFKFDDAPKELQYSLGGDEDYVIVSTTTDSYLLEKILQRLTVCSYKHIVIEGLEVYITTHS